jgi:multicomponent Na+:H+ antiporter subunit D
MSWEPIVLLGLVASSMVPSVIIFALGEEQVKLRTRLNLGGAIIKVALNVVLLVGVARGLQFEARIAFLPGVDFVLRADPLSLLFVSLSAVLWLVTTIYAVTYLEGSPRRSQFFGFFGVCVTATVGIALSGNLVTFVIFYEWLTMSTYPLVVHRGTSESLSAGRTYLAYTVGGGAVVLLGVAGLHALAGPIEFIPGGALDHLAAVHRPTLTVLFAVLVGGMAVKAALVPLHGWLPVAMVAPAPVSALLHAVAVVKAGSYGITRIVLDVYGFDLAASLGVLQPLALAAAVTIVYGSIRALHQDELKKRLAFSTVSQLSYIVLGVAVAGLTSLTGGLVHLVHQGVMKVTLFYCAGNIAETLGIHHISQMRGVGRKMPITMSAFTVAAIGMIGLPPTAGFISKWHLGLGGLEAGAAWVIPVLVVSSLLNAAYFLPVIYTAWLAPVDDPSEGEPFTSECRWGLLAPPLVTGTATIALGLLANWGASPLSWARLIAERLPG